MPGGWHPPSEWNNVSCSSFTFASINDPFTFWPGKINFCFLCRFLNYFMATYCCDNKLHMCVVMHQWLWEWVINYQAGLRLKMLTFIINRFPYSWWWMQVSRCFIHWNCKDSWRTGILFYPPDIPLWLSEYISQLVTLWNSVLWNKEHGKCIKQ